MTDQPEELAFEAELDAPPDKVWRTLSEPGLREAWLGEGGEVVEARPPERLVLKWTNDEPATFVTFEVRPGEAGGAHLTIVHRPASAEIIRIEPLRADAGQWRMAA